MAPDIAVGDGALGFWKALDEAFPSTVTNDAGTTDPERSRQAAEVGSAQRASGSARNLALGKPRCRRRRDDDLAEKYAPKYDKAVDCLLRDRDALLTFFDFPAEHWTHLRTSNPIESAFATVWHRTVRMKGALTQDTARLMVFKLIMAAAKSWRRLEGQNQLPKIVRGVKFRDGIEVANQEMSAA